MRRAGGDEEAARRIASRMGNLRTCHGGDNELNELIRSSKEIYDFMKKRGRSSNEMYDLMKKWGFPYPEEDDMQHHKFGEKWRTGECVIVTKIN